MLNNDLFCLYTYLYEYELTHIVCRGISIEKYFYSKPKVLELTYDAIKSTRQTGDSCHPVKCSL